ncbi:universal stress protein [Nucisporomicrobium flavum]|jgi:nucleotide-binding universal stress UspA family protein|uniref:universal stress protein n=1 Tax=Nucisporomicrobium flavum TaxID=2785915 RepID=UPI0018F4BACF|nr:universal stress protein [Nucisporomicrobium flavum]
MDLTSVRRGATGPVLVGVDGHDHDARVVTTAGAHADRLGTGLQVVHVLDVAGEPLRPATLPTVALRRSHERRRKLDDARAELRERLQTFVTGLTDVDLANVDLRTTVGDPATVLLAMSRRACLLVLGTRSGPARSPFLLGTVCQDVAVHASCPVLLVPWAKDGDEPG